jgi:hypothetical protein
MKTKAFNRGGPSQKDANENAQNQRLGKEQEEMCKTIRK